MKGPEDKGPTVIAEADEKVDEADLDSYMDSANADGNGPTAKERSEWLHNRYSQINNAYKAYLLEYEQAEAVGNKEALNKLRDMFRENYKARKFVVKALRASGETVKDKAVPG